MKKTTRFLVMILLLVLLVSAGMALSKGFRVEDEPNRTITNKAFTKNAKSSDVIEIMGYENLKSKNFPQGFAIKVKNISGRPIYFVGFHINLSDVEPDGSLMMSAEWGRSKLIDFNEVPNKEDKVIEPNETVNVSVKVRDEKNLTRFFRESKTTSLNLVILNDSVNFGDQTGYRLGQFSSRKISQIASLEYGDDCNITGCYKWSVAENQPGCQLEDCEGPIAYPNSYGGVCSQYSSKTIQCFDDRGRTHRCSFSITISCSPQ